MMDLSRSTLHALPANISRPKYDPAEVRTGIVHLGFGGFHRAHLARYTHDLMERRSDAREWGIVGVGLRQADADLFNALEPQDCLYTLVERQGAEESVTVIGSVRKLIFAAASSLRALAEIDDAATRVVSLTVTENGYCLDAATKKLDRSHPAIVHDLAHPDQPVSAIGLIVEAYRRRMISGASAFTALTCDNIQHNGLVLRDAVLRLARWRDAQLADWIAANATFPSTMVDRITPVTTRAHVEELATGFGLIDRWPVFCERFKQWVIEDDFVAGRPAWEEVGAQFVPDVAPYEFMKLRLLNASHLAVAGLGRLAGYVYIDQTLRDPTIAQYMRALMDRETGPTLLPVPGIDLDAYKAQLVARFSNEAIKDTVDRVNTDAPVNLLLDPIRDRLAGDQSIELLALALAAWLRRVAGVDDEGNEISISHPQAKLLRDTATMGGSDPRPLLGLTSIFGSLGGQASLVAPVERWLGLLYRIGAKATVEHSLGMRRR